MRTVLRCTPHPRYPLVDVLWTALCIILVYAMPFLHFFTSSKQNYICLLSLTILFSGYLWWCMEPSGARFVILSVATTHFTGWFKAQTVRVDFRKLQESLKSSTRLLESDLATCKKQLQAAVAQCHKLEEQKRRHAMQQPAVEAERRAAVRDMQRTFNERVAAQKEKFDDQLGVVIEERNA